jgi:hypothetical protein
MDSYKCRGRQTAFSIVRYALPRHVHCILKVQKKRRRNKGFLLMITGKLLTLYGVIYWQRFI